MFSHKHQSEVRARHSPRSPDQQGPWLSTDITMAVAGERHTSNRAQTMSKDPRLSLNGPLSPWVGSEEAHVRLISAIKVPDGEIPLYQQSISYDRTLPQPGRRYVVFLKSLVLISAKPVRSFIVDKHLHADHVLSYSIFSLLKDSLPFVFWHPKVNKHQTAEYCDSVFCVCLR